MGRPAFEKAVFETTGLCIDLSTVDWFGRTDYDICATALENFGYRGDITEIMPSIFKFFSFYFEQFIRANMKSIDAIPYADKLLQALRSSDIGLLTGNIKQTAYLKLEAAGFAGIFPFGVGAFGSESRERDLLFPLAMSRMKEHYSTAEYNRVFIIGDSPRDIQCAHSNDAIAFAVATGKLTCNELKNYNPDYLFKNFRDIDRILAVLLQDS
jgi:phosphoglycolate phosphatase-like HAD superfamily hydrolase